MPGFDNVLVIFSCSNESACATNPATKQTFSTLQLFYVSNQVTQTYLSRDCCEKLQTFPQNFPPIGSYPPATIAGATTAASPTTSPAPSSQIMLEEQRSYLTPAQPMTTRVA